MNLKITNKNKLILITLVTLMAMVTIGTALFLGSNREIEASATMQTTPVNKTLTIENILKPQTPQQFITTPQGGKSVVQIAPVQQPKTTVQPKAEEEKPVQVESVAELFVVNTDALNIREAADVNSKKLGVYYKGQIVEVTAKEGVWAKTNDGYVHSDYLITKDVHNESIKKNHVVVSRGGSMPRGSVSSISAPSGLSIRQIALLVSGTGLEGTEEAIFEVEQEDGINAYYTIAISKLESDSGRSSLAKSKNNLFGARGDNGYLSYGSKSESIRHFGQFMKSLYVEQGLITLSQINPKYCPPNPEWKSMVASIISSDRGRLN